MGSSHCGEVGLGKGRSTTSSSSSSSSSKKGKSSKTSLEKPKQPQRGLGVAQLEKIRLHNQFMANYNHLHNSLHSSFHHNTKQDEVVTVDHVTFSTSSSSSLFGFQSSTMMEFGESEPNNRYCQSTSRNIMTQNNARMPVTLPLLDQTMEWTKRRHDRSHSTGSMSQNSDNSSGSQELDLELRLSI
ncbi:putative SPEAR family protein [Dioscorea sansibarensis]